MIFKILKHLRFLRSFKIQILMLHVKKPQNICLFSFPLHSETYKHLLTFNKFFALLSVNFKWNVDTQAFNFSEI